MPDSLYDMSKELMEVTHAAITEDGEVLPELEKKLDELTLVFKDKVMSVSKWTMNLESKEEALDREIARLQKRKRITEALRKRLQEYIKWSLEHTGRKKMDFDTFTLAVVANPPSVEVVNENDIPALFIRIKQISEIDKQGILRALKQGEEVPGARLVEGKTHLRMR